MKTNRVFLVVLDGVGLGSLPDADLYGDAGSNTLVHTAMAVGGLNVPNFARWGLGRLAAIPGVEPVTAPEGAFALLGEKSPGKDTMTGHWEMAGLILRRPFPTYPKGFPPQIIRRFSEAIGRPVLGNRKASGTEILVDLGAEHLRTRLPIVYTSADSVFQIAAHEKVIDRELLYAWCLKAREILQGRHGVGRVIARPFIGEPGAFVRTGGRRDFTLPPVAPTLLDLMKEAGLNTIGLGKIEDIFAGRGLTRSDHTVDNPSTLEALLRLAREDFSGLVFANCVDFDMKYGHRNDAAGFAAALNAADEALGRLAALLRPGDLLLITADHGCDPVTPSTDHSREYVPLLAVGPGLIPGDLGSGGFMSDIAATIAELFGLPSLPAGRSFAARIGLV